MTREPQNSDDEVWAAYAAELEDSVPDSSLPFLDEESAAYDGAHDPREANYDRPSGPRDWTPAPDDEPFDPSSIVAESGPTPPVHPASRALWLVAGISLILALLMAFSILPGGGVGAGVFGVLTFGCGAGAAFASSPRMSDSDPYDDGARV
ncbi:hypothetical protein I6E29_04295 [Arcanobacterium haemolyticum]|nr:hypothetical protein [Arcanobacterium haemolyticum]